MTHRYACRNPACPFYRDVPTATAEEAIKCHVCGEFLELVIGAPAIVWTGPIGQRYRDKDKQGYHAPDGINMYSRKTPDGKPALVHLDNWSEVGRFCKQEGLSDPRELPRNYEVAEDGKRVLNTRGTPGTEL